MYKREKVIAEIERVCDEANPWEESPPLRCDISYPLLLYTIALLKAQEPITGETSDGYHTFNELYRHRAVLFSVIVANYPERAWKSKMHHDGTMYGDMFIVGIDTPDGQAAYHYDIDPYWDMFKCRVLDNAPEWDGHTPAQAIERIGGLALLKAQEPRVMPLEEIPERQETTGWLEWRDGDFYAAILYANDLKVDYMKFCTSCAFMKKEYGVTVRCWTSRPTDEQREATPWEK